MEYLPDKNSQYNDVVYWDERYKTEQSFDWLGSFSKFQHLLEKVVKKEDSILMLAPAACSSAALEACVSQYCVTHYLTFRLTSSATSSISNDQLSHCGPVPIRHKAPTPLFYGLPQAATGDVMTPHLQRSALLTTSPRRERMM